MRFAITTITLLSTLTAGMLVPGTASAGVCVTINNKTTCTKPKPPIRLNSDSCTPCLNGCSKDANACDGDTGEPTGDWLVGALNLDAIACELDDADASGGICDLADGDTWSWYCEGTRCEDDRGMSWVAPDGVDKLPDQISTAIDGDEFPGCNKINHEGGGGCTIDCPGSGFLGLCFTVASTDHTSFACKDQNGTWHAGKGDPCSW